MVKCGECGSTVEEAPVARRVRRGKKWKTFNFHKQCVAAFNARERRRQAVHDRTVWAIKNPYRG